MNVKEIASILGRPKRTIEREIAKGTIELLNQHLLLYKRYCADVGQRIYDERASNKGPAIKIGYNHKLAKYIEKKIKNDKYSPYAALEEAKNVEGLEVNICLKTLYNYIENDVFLEITNKDLPVKKNGKKRKYKKCKVSLNNTRGTNIEERSEEANNREVYGHWEMDTVVSGKKNGLAALLVLTERFTRQEIIFKINSKSQKCVIKELNKIERKIGAKDFREKFKTITVDNGTEFLAHEQMEKSLKNKTKRAKIYCRDTCRYGRRIISEEVSRRSKYIDFVYKRIHFRQKRFW
jgi:IS30 family transposase